ncbi:MAG TPA: hypothetical protein VH593_10650, partial [Ktedonobacteraceae bacterium]
PYASPPPIPGAYAPYMQAPYGMMIDPYKGRATAGLVLGIVAVVGDVMVLVFAFLPFISIICGILGIIFSVQGRRSTTQRTSATTGLVLSIIGMIIAIILLILFILVLYTMHP